MSLIVDDDHDDDDDDVIYIVLFIINPHIWLHGWIITSIIV